MFPQTYLVRQGQTQLDLVGSDISVSAALDGAEGVESRAGGAGDTEGVHYGGTVSGRGGWVRYRWGYAIAAVAKLLLEGDDGRNAGGVRAFRTLGRGRSGF